VAAVDDRRSFSSRGRQNSRRLRRQLKAQHGGCCHQHPIHVDADRLAPQFCNEGPARGPWRRVLAKDHSHRHEHIARKAILRTSIVDALNEYLRVKAVRAEVIVNTLKGSAEKERTIERLELGEITFGDAYQEAGFL
jgi:hypothetical protein